MLFYDCESIDRRKPLSQTVPRMLVHVTIAFALILPPRPPDALALARSTAAAGASEATRHRRTHARMQLFPSEEDNSSVEAITPTQRTQLQTRGEQMATLLSELVERPEAAAALLDAATPMLLGPFRPGPQEPGSIFADDTSLEEKIEVYRRTLEARIGSARKRETKEALCVLRDHVLSSAALLLP